MRVNLAALLAMLLFNISASAFPQSPNGSISGVILDPAARSIPGAEIIVVNDLTGVRYVSSTNSEGIYAMPNLPPGSYRIQVSKAGFKSIIKPDIVLNVQDAMSLNFTLPIGAPSVTVTVEGGSPLIDTQNAAVSTVVDRQLAENLPMNGRSFQTLIYLTPGVVATASTGFDTGQFSVNGQRPASNYWMVDGVSANIGIGASSITGNGLGGAAGSFSALGGTNSLVSVDALQEFRIQTSTFAPEFGRTPGAQISILTRSGTNQFHGTAFDYFRNEALDASNWFNGYTNNPPLPKAEERQNDFGGTFSGRLIRDKTFFFFSYEGLRLKLPQTSLTTVPDLQARQTAVPAMLPYLNAYPLPNGPEVLASCDASTDPACPPSGEGPTGAAQLNASYPNPATLDAYSVRLDHQLTDKWTVFGRYNYSPSEFVTRGAGGNAALSVVQHSSITTQTATVGAAWTISPTLTNNLLFNYSRVSADGFFGLDNFAGAVPLASPPFPSPFTTKNSEFSFDNFGLNVGAALAVGRTARNRQRQINLVETVAHQKGSHSLKFGADFRRLSPEYGPAEYRQTVGFTSVSDSKVGNASFGFLTAAKDVTLMFHNLGIYAQDTWRVRPRLTVTYGLRWDVDYAPSSADGPNIPAVTGYSLTNLSGLTIAPTGTPPFHTTYNNFAPRLGAAYQLNSSQAWQAVFRGGFGVFYDLVSAETGNVLSQADPPFASFAFFGSTQFPFSDATSAAPPIPSSGTLSEFWGFNPNLKLPYTLQWNVALEQSLGKDQAISASYVGAQGRRLLQTTELSNPPTNPEVGLAGFVDNTASSNYNALQVQFRRRLSGGLQTLASYTWSHSIDSASTSYADTSSLNRPGRTNENRGSSDFDVRNAFSVALTYDLPAPKHGAIKKNLLSDWSIESLILAHSASPVDLTDVNFRFVEEGIGANVRPDFISGSPLYVYGTQYPGGKAFNGAAFTDPPVDTLTGFPVRQGNAPRNVLRGFGFTQWDLAVHRNFTVHESLRLQFRAEMFNVLNHPNFGPPQNSFGQAGFGVSTEMLGQSLSSGSVGSGGFAPLFQVGGPRSVQLALKFVF